MLNPAGRRNLPKPNAPQEEPTKKPDAPKKVPPTDDKRRGLSLQRENLPPAKKSSPDLLDMNTSLPHMEMRPYGRPEEDRKNPRHFQNHAHPGPPIQKSSSLTHIGSQGPGSSLPPPRHPPQQFMKQTTQFSQAVPQLPQPPTQHEMSISERRSLEEAENVRDIKWNKFAWDAFRIIADRKRSLGLDGKYRNAIVLIKVLLYLIFMGGLLATLVASKLTFFILLRATVIEDRTVEDAKTHKELLEFGVIDLYRRHAFTLLIGVISAPGVLWVVISFMRHIFVTSHDWPLWTTLIWFVLIETLGSIGLAMLTFSTMREISMTRGLVFMNATTVIPALVACLVRNQRRTTGNSSTSSVEHEAEGCSFCYCSPQVCAVFKSGCLIMGATGQVATVLAVVLMYWTEVIKEDRIWKFPLAVLLSSMHGLANYCDHSFTICGRVFKPDVLLNELYKMKERLSLLLCSWRSMVFIVTAMVLLDRGPTELYLYNPLAVVHENRTAEFEMRTMVNVTADMAGDTILTGVKSAGASLAESLLTDVVNATEAAAEALLAELEEEPEMGYLFIHVCAVLHVTSSFLSWLLAVCACKLSMQNVGFSVPCALASPVSFIFLMLGCHYEMAIFENLRPLDGFCMEMDRTKYIVMVGAYFALWFSNILTTHHIWGSSDHRLPPVEDIFVLPGYYSIMMDQWLLTNRRASKIMYVKTGDDFLDEEIKNLNDDIVPRVYACATMWHETPNEMKQLLKSILGMDTDHYRMVQGQKGTNRRLSDYFEFETHIIFDDAFELDDKGRSIPNSFVRKNFFEAFRDAICEHYQKETEVERPRRMVTPYGGRLTWTLKGHTNLVVHLKDKDKIRHKKRWSQIFYMYYLLGYRLMARHNGRNVDPSEKQQVQREKMDYPAIFKNSSLHLAETAQQTYVLALDGDVDFQPDAVKLLVDLMKTDRKIGATCGRIHPIGYGPMVWYQKFEYAIAHWLQKAAEHVFGCVLCSPGCFSLFRGSALMDDNVCRTYVTPSSEARHYVQYDQGEDRWLCTLLLQQGYRVEYSAAADALTYAPETFNEFYNQRRRWGPSTLSNIIDLLSTWKETVALNSSMSYAYIVYQATLFMTTILGPATIVMMIAGAYNAVLGISMWQSYVMSLTPPVFYTIICFKCKGKMQCEVAAWLSAAYAFIMLVVVIGTIINGLQESLTSPNVIFLFFLISVFIVAALFHPEEFTCLCYGMLYFICIPSGYLFLTIYSLCNMNNVSWGTREVAKRKTAEELAEEDRKNEERQNKMKGGFWAKIGVRALFDEIRGMYSQVFTAISTDQQKNTDPSQRVLSDIRDLLHHQQMQQYGTLSATQPKDKTKGILKVRLAAESSTQTDESTCEKPQEMSPGGPKPPVPDDYHWLNLPILGGARLTKDGARIVAAPVEQMELEEQRFFIQLIESYLAPLEDDRQKKEQIAVDLRELRNNVVFAVIMVNLLWIIITFQLQYHQDILQVAIFVPIPRSDDLDRMEYFEPLGLVFLFFFFVITVVQFFGMLWHRLSTLFHLIATAEIDWDPFKTMNDALKVGTPKWKNFTNIDENRRRLESVHEQEDLARELEMEHMQRMRRLHPTQTDPRVEQELRRRTSVKRNKATRPPQGLLPQQQRGIFKV